MPSLAPFVSSSYLDAVVLRDRDATGTSNSDPAESWSYASDAVLEERVYYLHDWHQDLVQLIGDDGAAVERVHYSAYSVPFGLHPADLDLDGDVDGSDFSKFSTLYSNGTYDLLADFDHDGDEDATDYVNFANTLYPAGETLGRGNLSRSTTDNRIGYAGYQWDRFVTKYHVRNRVYEPTTGRWLNRDPLAFAGGTANLYEYCYSSPSSFVDPTGLWPWKKKKKGPATGPPPAPGPAPNPKTWKDGGIITHDPPGDINPGHTAFYVRDPTSPSGYLVGSQAPGGFEKCDLVDYLRDRPTDETIVITPIPHPQLDPEKGRKAIDDLLKNQDKSKGLGGYHMGAKCTDVTCDLIDASVEGTDILDGGPDVQLPALLRKTIKKIFDIPATDEISYTPGVRPPANPAPSSGEPPKPGEGGDDND